MRVCAAAASLAEVNVPLIASCREKERETRTAARARERVYVIVQKRREKLRVSAIKRRGGHGPLRGEMQRSRRGFFVFGIATD